MSRTLSARVLSMRGTCCGATTCIGMPVEGEHRARQAALSRQTHGAAYDRAVPHMHAVKGADGHRPRPARHGGKVGEHLHQSLTSSLRA